MDNEQVKQLSWNNIFRSVGSAQTLSTSCFYSDFGVSSAYIYYKTPVTDNAQMLIITISLEETYVFTNVENFVLAMASLTSSH